MSTTWNTEGTTGGSWNIESGGVASAGAVASSSIATGGMEFENLAGISLLDDALLTFGIDNDFAIKYDSTEDRLEFNNVSGTTLIALTTSGLLLDRVNFNVLSSLPTPTEGSMVYYNDNYYLGFPA